MAGRSIELRGLTKKFSEIAVDNIDLTVASGEFFSLLGPSGCGKTTTLRLIAGFEQPTSGQILLDEVLDRAGAEARRLGHRFGGPGRYPGCGGGPWLCRILVPSGLRAVVVPSGFSATVQPHLWMAMWW